VCEGGLQDSSERIALDVILYRLESMNGEATVVVLDEIFKDHAKCQHSRPLGLQAAFPWFDVKLHIFTHLVTTHCRFHNDARKETEIPCSIPWAFLITDSIPRVRFVFPQCTGTCNSHFQKTCGTSRKSGGYGMTSKFVTLKVIYYSTRTGAILMLAEYYEVLFPRCEHVVCIHATMMACLTSSGNSKTTPRKTE